VTLPVRSFTEIVRLRQSVRRFASRPVEREKLERIKEVGRLAASADNRQPWRFFLLHGEGRGEFDLLLRENFRGAPVVIVACASPAAAWNRRFDGRNYAWVDVGIAVTEMVLAATAEGLGTCWVASLDPAAVRTVLGLEEEWEPVTAVALGYPAEPLEAKTKNRKPMNEVWEER
jgi:nitroreductase